MFKREKHNIENKNVIRKDNINILVASIFFFGSIIATSYFPLATKPNIEQTLTYKPYTPNCSGEKYCVKIGSMTIGII